MVVTADYITILCYDYSLYCMRVFVFVCACVCVLQSVIVMVVDIPNSPLDEFDDEEKEFLRFRNNENSCRSPLCTAVWCVLFGVFLPFSILSLRFQIFPKKKKKVASFMVPFVFATVSQIEKRKYMGMICST